MTDPAEIYLSPPCCSDMVGEGRLWCENDEWPEGDCGTPEEHRPATRYVRADLAHADLMSTERVIMVRESEWREMREALSDIASGSYSGVLLTSYPPKDPAVERARAALAKSEATHPAPDGCGREGKQIEAAARAIADAWGETWECCCTEQRGLDCDCGYAMTDERDGCDERLTREDCRKAARAALSAFTKSEAVP